jgi:hypothetical protein
VWQETWDAGCEGRAAVQVPRWSVRGLTVGTGVEREEGVTAGSLLAYPEDPGPLGV